MKTVSLQTIKKRGISFLEEDLKKGPVHVIQNNALQYVILNEAAYEELLEHEAESHYERVRQSLLDLKAKKITRGTAKDLIKELGLEEK